ncbi:glycosyltransferase family 2 protein [Clostridium tagluense]|uniref:glycosyltransferase family 2 protein n=1 Tax=Clostridium tagluense TaxID=360422 RepID=UPI001C6E01CF|nr:glycosyltransferase family 2 protein [Clostridium tagluense]MBW9156998.1 glycosyltransferase family 2 protein [Clostridium tagluense]WLC64985.1 glycosyltransferase family 2 protein [Clostridium tagluense]
MKATIIIPNYNGQKYLKDCLDTLFKQSFKSFETIIVDNASKDGSYDFILENYPQVKLIYLKENYGFSKAVNEGIKVSDSEYVVLLNNDTEVGSYWLENLVNCIESDEKIFSCCSKMIRYSEREKVDDAGDEYNILGWAYKRGDGVSINKYDSDGEVFSSCAGAAIYRKAVFNEIGYFDESFFAYMEDVDISYRAKIYGYKNMYCSSAKVYHIGSATSGSKYNPFKIKLAARNNLYVVLKNMPLLQLLINLPFIILGHIIKFIFFAKKGYMKDYMSGLKEGIKSSKKISKVKYRNKNIINYIIIQWKMIINTFKYIIYKLM